MRGRDSWSNWAGNQRAGRPVRAVGSGHSFNDIAVTRGCLVSLARLDRILDSDREAGLVRVQAGATIGALARELERRGLALRSTGDIDRQTLGGAIATGTHGTGLAYGNLSSDVVAVVLASADGSLLRIGADEPATLRAARVSLGALGVIAELTLRCVPAFRLRFAERPAPLERALAELPRLLAGHEHAELLIFPYSDVASVRTRDRTGRPTTAAYAAARAS